MSWQTRQLAGFIAAGYMTDKGQNPGLEAASSLAFDKIEQLQLQEQEIADRESSPSKFDEEGNIIPIFPEPKEASFERLMGSLGNPGRWK